MRHKSETYLILALAVFALSGLTALRFLDAPAVRPADPVAAAPVAAPAPVANVPDASTGPGWFAAMRPFCNPVDVDTRMRWQPAPESPDGQMHRAACYALAGRIDQARSVIQALPQDLQYRAAGVVFEAGHSAADAGDEVAAGPLMELVVEFWPNHYMALYHAGAAAFERAEYGPASAYLERFLREYAVEDGWRTNAERMLETMTRIEG